MKNAKKLSDWAKDQNIEYKQAWNLYKSGGISAETKETKTGRIFVMEAKASSEKKEASFGVPMMVETTKTKQQTKASRFNRTGFAPDTAYPQIQLGVDPFVINSNNSSTNSSVSVREAIKLCQKAYWNFPIFGNTIDAMTEFSTNKLFFREGNSKSRQFFQDLFESLNILDLQDKFFRERYRSSNTFIYRFESVPNDDNIGKLNKTFGAQAKSGVKLPSKYIILNPCDISVQSNISFSNNAIYFKTLNGYEINRLKVRQTPEEKNLFDSLPPDIQKQIDSGAGTVFIPLDNSKVYAVFYRKQDYEPLAVPMGFAVLKDIEWKAEMKHIDMAVSRTMQNVILLVKMGYESKTGDYMFDQKAADMMKELFESESVGKTLVADFTTDAQFVIPTIGDFLDPKKYQIVNEDIKTGLNYILTGTDQKFSNQYIQVQLFIQRLQRARESFLNEFLIPEMKRISKDMGFRSIPIPYFEDIDLRDDAEFNRIIAQLAQYGILTAEEVFTAMETGRIPTGEESLESWQRFKEAKDKGFYQPIIGGPADQMNILQQTSKNALKLQDGQQEHDIKMQTKQQKHEAANPPPAPPPAIHIGVPMKQQSGRPAGTKRKQSTKKSSPMRASDETYSLSKIKDNIILSMELNKKVESSLCKKHNVKLLDESQKLIAKEICDVIVANQNPENWNDENIKKYVENPINDNEERLREIDEISYDNQISPSLASILIASKIENNE